MQLELWYPLNEAPIFIVSNHGRVQNMLTGEMMAELVDEDEEYVGVWLIDEYGKPFFAPIEAMVVEAFLGPVDGLETIEHIDGDPFNNCVWNLRVDESYWDWRERNGQNCE